MAENKTKLQIVEDCKAVIEEAKSMGCNKVRALYNIPLENMELIVQALEKQISKKSILMGDLISRSELLKQLETKPKNSTVPKEVKLKDLITYYHEKVIEVIEDMPTAYDVDKVVEELDLGNELIDTENFSKVMKDCFDDMRIVVKQGGVSDDVCEYKYCPYCGKRIKVVE